MLGYERTLVAWYGRMATAAIGWGILVSGWGKKKTALEVATLPSADTFIDGASLGLAPCPAPVIVSAGIHKIRCVSRFGPSLEFRVFLLPGRRYLVTLNLETGKHSIRSSKDPFGSLLQTWINPGTEP